MTIPTMRAVVLHGPNDLRIETRPIPRAQPGGLVVRTAYVGVCGSDVRNWRHGSPRLTNPEVPGHEVVGEVTESRDPRFPVGARVAVCPGIPCGVCRACSAGRQNQCADRVVLGYDLPGGMEEYFAVPPDALKAGCVVLLPDSLSLRAAVLAEPLHTVINGQDLARVGPDDSVLVIGLGAIGSLHAALALSRAARQVVAVDVRTERVAAATAVLGRETAQLLGDGPEAAEELRLQGGGTGWTVAIIAAGAPSAVELAMSSVGASGRVLAFAGLPPALATVPIDVNQLHYRQLEIVGAFGGTPSTYARAVAWLAESRLDLTALVADEFPLDRAESAYLNVESGHGLKTVLTGAVSELRPEK